MTAMLTGQQMKMAAVATSFRRSFLLRQRLAVPPYTHRTKCRRFLGTTNNCIYRTASTTATATATATAADAKGTSTTSSSSSSSSSSLKQEPESTNPYYPHIFQPLPLHPSIGTLPNRIIMGSMHTGLEGHSIPKFLLPLLGAEDDHTDLSELAAYFVERAKGGVGLMVTGGISPNKVGWLGPFAAKMSTQREMQMHKIVTDSVHSVTIPSYGTNGETTTTSTTTMEKARICMQILHAGRYAMHPWAVSASPIKSPISPFRPRALSLRGIQRTIADFVHCATLAKEAGYDGVEIMGSEGYLINQFLVRRTNHRTDKYGGLDFAHRMRFAVDIVRETRQAVGEDFILIFRLSMLDLIEDGSTWEEIKMLARAIEDAGATIINTGIGWHEARIPTIAGSVPRGAFAYVTRKLRLENVVSIPLCTTNRINAPHVAEKILADGDADLISMARPFLADPYIVAKSREGRVEEINTCIACNQACLDHAFVGKTASCLVNPRACHELDMVMEPDSIPVQERLRIAVVGSGPAGLAFATTAATIGHHVTLFEKADEIGGQFNMAKRIPGKEEFHETLRYFRVQLDKLEKRGKLDVKLGTEITYDYMENSTRMVETKNGAGPLFDRWILATGVDPRIPSIPGLDHPNVLSYIDVLRHKAHVGRRVAIIGAGGIGFDVAEYLLHHDDDVNHDISADEMSTDEFLLDWNVDPKNESRGGLLVHNNDHAATTDGTISGKTGGKAPRRQLVLMQRKKGKLGAGLGKTTGWIHRATLAKSNAVEMIDGVTYERIDENGHLHITIGKGNDKTSRILDVDNIVVCAGQTSKRELEQEAREHAAKTHAEGGEGESDDSLASRVYTIGGAYEALELDAKRAIDMGTRLALKIHHKSVKPGSHKFEADVGPEEKMYKLLKRWM